MQHIEHVMGTAVTIDVADPLPPATLRALIDDTCDWLHEVDQRFSTYRADSEVTRLDRNQVRAEHCSDLALADAYATAALAMGVQGLDWLARLTERGYESAAVTADGLAFSSHRLPAEPAEPPTPSTAG